MTLSSSVCVNFGSSPRVKNVVIGSVKIILLTKRRPARTSSTRFNINQIKITSLPARGTEQDPYAIALEPRTMRPVEPARLKLR